MQLHYRDEALGNRVYRGFLFLILSARWLFQVLGDTIVLVIEGMVQRDLW